MRASLPVQLFLRHQGTVFWYRNRCSFLVTAGEARGWLQEGSGFKLLFFITHATNVLSFTQTSNFCVWLRMNVDLEQQSRWQAGDLQMRKVSFIESGKWNIKEEQMMENACGRECLRSLFFTPSFLLVASSVTFMFSFFSKCVRKIWVIQH